MENELPAGVDADLAAAAAAVTAGAAGKALGVRTSVFQVGAAGAAAVGLGGGVAVSAAGGDSLLAAASESGMVGPRDDGGLGGPLVVAPAEPAIVSSAAGAELTDDSAASAAPESAAPSVNEACVGGKGRKLLGGCGGNCCRPLSYRPAAATSVAAAGDTGLADSGNWKRAGEAPGACRLAKSSAGAGIGLSGCGAAGAGGSAGSPASPDSVALATDRRRHIAPFEPVDAARGACQQEGGSRGYAHQSASVHNASSNTRWESSRSP